MFLFAQVCFHLFNPEHLEIERTRAIGHQMEFVINCIYGDPPKLLFEQIYRRGSEQAKIGWRQRPGQYRRWPREQHYYVAGPALCGGELRPELVDLDDATLIRRVHAEMRVTMKVTGDPVFTQVVRWPRAIPQYHLGHLDRVARIDAAVARLPGLFVTGNAFKGVAMNDVVEQAGLTAARVLTMPAPPP